MDGKVHVPRCIFFKNKSGTSTSQQPIWKGGESRVRIGDMVTMTLPLSIGVVRHNFTLGIGGMIPRPACIASEKESVRQEQELKTIIYDGGSLTHG